MALPEQKRSIGVFPNRFDAEKAINELKATGFSMDKVSVIGPDTNPEEVEAAANNLGGIDNQSNQAARAGTISGGALGGLAGVLTGIATLTIPGLGPVVAGGAAATALASTLAGTAVGATAGGLVGGMSSLAIPELKAQAYKDWLSRGAYLVMLEGSEDDIGRAETILSRGGIQDWFVYQ
ncbi:general stress protein [Chroococcidiopsis sp. CCMEE 29]|uniref:general stress protein n=1 Tax=Chroococcidiopsis sp. CCMEE 29 TaxID=155894 RepID=UPI0020204B79|nr:general stress protein [Chroococcidiopsis sp. CCMEE 29]